VAFDRGICIQTDKGWLYLAAVIELFNHQLVGWRLQPGMQAGLLAMAGYHEK